MEPFDKASRVISLSFRTFMRYPSPVHVCETKVPPASSTKVQYKDYPQLWYCREGAYLHETEHSNYFCEKGSVVIVPPGVAHCLRASEAVGAVLLRINLPFDYFSTLSFDAAPNTATLLFLPPFLRERGVPLPEYFPLSEYSQTAAETFLADLASEKQKEAQKRASLENMLSLPEFALPASVKVLAAAEAKSKFTPILQTLSYIQTNYAEKITAEHLCQVSSLCRTNLFRWVRQYLGISWSAYLTMLRVIRANYALVHTNYSIAYISDMCGFSHSSHMSSCYKRYKGILPKDDRQKQLIYQKRYGKLHIAHDYFMDNFFD